MALETLPPRVFHRQRMLPSPPSTQRITLPLRPGTCFRETPEKGSVDITGAPLQTLTECKQAILRAIAKCEETSGGAVGHQLSRITQDQQELKAELISLWGETAGTDLFLAYLRGGRAEFDAMRGKFTAQNEQLFATPNIRPQTERPIGTPQQKFRGRAQPIVASGGELSSQVAHNTALVQRRRAMQDLRDRDRIRTSHPQAVRSSAEGADGGKAKSGRMWHEFIGTAKGDEAWHRRRELRAEGGVKPIGSSHRRTGSLDSSTDGSSISPKPQAAPRITKTRAQQCRRGSVDAEPVSTAEARLARGRRTQHRRSGSVDAVLQELPASLPEHSSAFDRFNDTAAISREESISSGSSSEAALASMSPEDRATALSLTEKAPASLKASPGRRLEVSTGRRLGNHHRQVSPGGVRGSSHRQVSPGGVRGQVSPGVLSPLKDKKPKEPDSTQAKDAVSQLSPPCWSDFASALIPRRVLSRRLALQQRVPTESQTPLFTLVKAAEMVSLDALLPSVVTEGSSPYRILAMNDAWLCVCGYNRSEVTGVTPIILQGCDSDVKELNTLRKSLVNSEPTSVRCVNYKSDGTPFRTTLRVKPVRAASTDLMLGVMEDITEAPDLPSDPQPPQAMVEDEARIKQSRAAASLVEEEAASDSVSNTSSLASPEPSARTSDARQPLQASCRPQSARQRSPSSQCLPRGVKFFDTMSLQGDPYETESKTTGNEDDRGSPRSATNGSSQMDRRSRCQSLFLKQPEATGRTPRPSWITQVCSGAKRTSRPSVFSQFLAPDQIAKALGGTAGAAADMLSIPPIDENEEADSQLTSWRAILSTALTSFTRNVEQHMAHAKPPWYSPWLDKDRLLHEAAAKELKTATIMLIDGALAAGESDCKIVLPTGIMAEHAVRILQENGYQAEMATEPESVETDTTSLAARKKAKLERDKQRERALVEEKLTPWENDADNDDDTDPEEAIIWPWAKREAAAAEAKLAEAAAAEEHFKTQPHTVRIPIEGDNRDKMDALVQSAHQEMSSPAALTTENHLRR